MPASPKGRLPGDIIVAALLAVAMLATAGPALAADSTVTSNADSGAGTLRAAVNAANANDEEDTISFDLPAGERTITLGSQITITDSYETMLDGTASDVTVGGNRTTGIFQVESGAKISMQSLTISNGAGGASGAGGIVNYGTLPVGDSTISGNSAQTIRASVPEYGGGISNKGGTGNVIDSTLNNNAASFGGADFGGGIYNRGGSVTVLASTLSGNQSGIYNDNGISDNGNAQTTVGNSIVVNQGDYVETSGSDNTFDSRGYNLIGNGNATSAFDQPGDRTGVEDPGLGPLGDNSGPTMTRG